MSTTTNIAVFFNISKNLLPEPNSFSKEMRELCGREEKKCPDLEFIFKYDIPSFLQYFAYAFTLAGLERITGVNQKQLGHYISGIRNPSEKTARKIESGIRHFAKDLESVSFV